MPDKLLRLRQQQNSQFTEQQPLIRGYLTAVNGSVKVANRPGYVYCVDDNGGRVQVFNPKVADRANLPVLLAPLHNHTSEMAVVDVDWENMRHSREWDFTPFLKSHAKDHEWRQNYPGADAMTVYPAAWSELRTNPFDGLTVYVSGVFYFTADGPKAFRGGIYDLTSYLPASEETCFVAVQLDKTTNAITFATGASIFDDDLLVPPIPARGDNVIVSAWVRLRSDTTAIGWKDIVNARTFINDRGADSFNQLAVESILFDLTPSQTMEEGRLQWDADNGTLQLGLPGGVSVLQLGQELQFRAKCDEAGGITNGQVVYVSDATGGNPLIKPATAATYAIASRIFGMATEPIAYNHFGYVTFFGLVRDIDTSALAEGDPVYLLADGSLSNTAPATPTPQVFVGITLRSHATEGVMGVNPRTNPTAAGIIYDNTDSSLAANDVQAAIDEVADAEFWQQSNSMAGRLWGGYITDNGDGTVIISAGQGLIKDEEAGPEDVPTSLFDGQGSKVSLVTWAEVAALAVTDNAYNYIYYDGADSTIKATTNFYSISFTRAFTLGRVYRTGTEIVVRLCGTNLWNFDRRVQLFGEEVFPVVKATGLVPSEAGTRGIAITAGVLWAELVNRFSIDAINTSTGDTFSYWYRDGSGGWTRTTGNTQINNTQYDDGDGTLGTLTANRYGVHWLYVVHDNNLHVVFGQGDYTLALAQAATVPASLPGLLAAYASLVGKVIVKKSDTNLYSVEQPAEAFFNSVGVTDHGDLAGLTDDDHTQYLLATGTRAGSTSQAQSFGATGVKADVIAESTAAAGVTVDGVKLKDADVYPLADTSGLGLRRTSWNSPTDDFLSGLGSGWGSWSTAGFTDPTTGINSINYPSLLWCAFPSGTNPVGFLPRSTAPATLAQCGQYCSLTLRSMPNFSYAGIRLDDGTTNNAIEILLRQQTAQVEIIKRETIGGSTTVTSLKTITFTPAWVGFHLNATGTWFGNWNSNGYMFINTPAVELLFTTSAYAWQPARIGITFYINATGLIGRAAIFDWYGATI